MYQDVPRFFGGRVARLDALSDAPSVLPTAKKKIGRPPVADRAVSSPVDATARLAQLWRKSPRRSAYLLAGRLAKKLWKAIGVAHPSELEARRVLFGRRGLRDLADLKLARVELQANDVMVAVSASRLDGSTPPIVVTSTLYPSRSAGLANHQEWADDFASELGLDSGATSALAALFREVEFHVLMMGVLPSNRPVTPEGLLLHISARVSGALRLRMATANELMLIAVATELESAGGDVQTRRDRWKGRVKAEG